MEERFRELAKNKDITDEDLFEELCYLYAKSRLDPREAGLDPRRRSAYFEHFKQTRKSNPSLSKKLGPDDQHLRLDIQMGNAMREDTRYYYIEKYEMNKRIQSLEQTLKTFMEQTKVERLSQEAVMQSLSNELDEFQEEFYDCQSEVKEQKERIGLIEDALKETIQIVMEPVPFVKDKSD
jgi:hypothetical protein